VWCINYETLPYLFELASYSGTLASGAIPIWMDIRSGLANGAPGTILGRPYFQTEKMNAALSAGDIGIFDFSFYIIGDRAPLVIDASTHVGFTSNTTYWRFVKRVDGQPWLDTYFTPKHGTATLSPFCALAATS
jgi:HK97 family phage major capsid protein